MIVEHDDPLHDDEQIRTALFINYGNVTRTAEMLGLHAGVLARHVNRVSSLKTDQMAARQLIVDRAEEAILDRLTTTEGDEQYETAKFILTSLGKELGWGATSKSAASLSLSDGNRTLSVRWNDGSEAEGGPEP
jgi:hypothetical protein